MNASWKALLKMTYVGTYLRRRSSRRLSIFSRPTYRLRRYVTYIHPAEEGASRTSEPENCYAAAARNEIGRRREHFSRTCGRLVPLVVRRMCRSRRPPTTESSRCFSRHRKTYTRNVGRCFLGSLSLSLSRGARASSPLLRSETAIIIRRAE